ncbi:chemotaxis protein CheW [Haliovirga abyssi]|uniref:Chemotaxis protein CheW n=1 Tax=Haliovirga abyssi TaxID=2996794 RepID=A0AAU9DXN2_9FUSO|nr:chemotaxis protein CheW [Haliovirga abyssi]BDU50150.1 chemotaxis protein CheW [Haliovirga abyssi]
MKVVSFELGEEKYAVQVKEIGEIIRVPKIEEVPNAEEYIEGVINLRGDIVPILNFNVKFKLPQKKLDEDSNILIIREEEQNVGILVDKVDEVINLNENKIVEAPELSIGIPKESFIGVVNYLGKLLILLDIKKLLSITEEGERNG